jgi:hypothetical protein
MLTMGLLAMSSTAMAADYEPFLWGVGAKLGTVVIPGAYPARFPDIITNYNFLDEGPRAGNENGDDPNRDLDPAGDPIFTSLRRVKGDVRFAADGFLAIDATNRIGATLGVNGAKGMTDLYFTANYDYVAVKKNPFWVTAGVGLGYGSMTFNGVDDEDSPRVHSSFSIDNEQLKIPYFPVRGRVEGQFHTDTMMYGLGIFAGTSIPSNMYYTDLAGNTQDAVGGPGNFLYLVNAGIELTVRYGDFKPPAPKPKKNKGGGGAKNNKNKNNGGGGNNGGSSGSRGGGGGKKGGKKGGGNGGR